MRTFLYKGPPGGDRRQTPSAARYGLANQTNPDLAILDLRIIGQRDGIETAMLLRQQSGLPVLFVTGEADPATRLRSAQAEPAAYLLKPVSTDRLLHAITIALQSNSNKGNGDGS